MSTCQINQPRNLATIQDFDENNNLQCIFLQVETTIKLIYFL